MSSRTASAARRAARRLKQLLTRERQLWADGLQRVAGVDEAGAGPLAGPVVAAAVIFPPGLGLEGVDDSKRLTRARREELSGEIRRRAAAYRVVRVEPAEIDSINIYQACLAAMRRAVEGLGMLPDHILVDARKIPGIDIPQEAVIKGDAKCHAIAAASILAKCERDQLMVQYETEYPGYGFASHKGYATASHREALKRLGPSPIHRQSFTLLPPPTLWDYAGLD